MHSTLNRRRFLATTTAAVAAASALPFRVSAAGSHPAELNRPGTSRTLIGLAAYSFRQYMMDSSHERQVPVPVEKRIDLFQWVDYAADQGCDGVELTSYYFPADLNDEYLTRLRRHVFLRGLQVSGSAVGNTFALPDGDELDGQVAYVKKWIDHCMLLGAPHLRVFAGNPKGIAKEQAIRQCVRKLRECGDYAAKRGVMIGIENHGGIVSQADVLEEIVNQADHDWVRINLDTGNFYSDHPYDDMARLAPYAVNVQFKVEINRVPGGKEPMDFERAAGILKAANYQGYVTLEYEAAEDPFDAVPGSLKKLRQVFAVGEKGEV